MKMHLWMLVALVSLSGCAGIANDPAVSADAASDSSPQSGDRHAVWDEPIELIPEALGAYTWPVTRAHGKCEFRPDFHDTLPDRE